MSNEPACLVTPNTDGTMGYQSLGYDVVGYGHVRKQELSVKGDVLLEITFFAPIEEALRHVKALAVNATGELLLSPQESKHLEMASRD
jgi:hypothetical protein